MVMRRGTPGDLEDLARVEAACFPPAEAASRRTLDDRLRHYPEHFYLMLDSGRVVSFVDGPAVDAPDLTDELYERADLHRPEGAWQMIFGVNTLPEYRRRGCAGQLIRWCLRDARERGRRGVVLTCKAGLVDYYSKFGFVSEGVTEKSVHGGATWIQMRLTIDDDAAPGGTA